MLCCVELCGGPMSSGSRPSPRMRDGCGVVCPPLRARNGGQIAGPLPWSPPTPLPPQPPPPAIRHDPTRRPDDSAANIATVARIRPPAVTGLDVAVPHRRQRAPPTTIHRSGCTPCSRWYMPKITRMHVPANRAPASSMANRNALASLATALVPGGDKLAGVTKRRNRRKARSAFSGAPDANDGDHRTFDSF